VAESQTAGRGQWQRSFTSDRGGLYLTAVLPFDGDGAHWRGFALAVGWAIVTAFRARSFNQLRLRWPNDLMIGDWKVGGILVSQATPDTLCVGLGLNVRNRPWLLEPGLQAVACRLADFTPEEEIDPEFLTEMVLGAIRMAHESFTRQGLRGFVDELNKGWGEARDVRLEMAPGSPCAQISGRFRGILPDGDLILEDSSGACVAVGSHLVNRLHEKQGS
jgi:BirA family biotin operon repressor/biotin-[acetyl-CoA-carboxylase] ligase